MTFRHFLVPTDGSGLSKRTIAEAVAFAADIGARITFLVAVGDPETSIYGETALLRTLDPELHAKRSSAVEQWGHDLLHEACALARTNGVTSEACLVPSSQPFEAIIATAEASGCDLILMASHGRHGVKGLLLGSETQKVLTHSRIPVLVYR